MTILTSLLNLALDSSIFSGKIDEVAVFDSETFEQVFPYARPVECNVRPSTRTMEHPIETGQSIADHRIINPLEIIMEVIVSSVFYNQTFNDIVYLFETATLLTVQTKFGTYSNMFITDLPHKESPEVYDSVVIQLRFKEVLFSDRPPTAYAPPPATPVTASWYSKVLNGELTPLINAARSGLSTVKAIAFFSR